MGRSSDHALHVNLLSIKDIKISNLEKKVKQLEKENNRTDNKQPIIIY